MPISVHVTSYIGEASDAGLNLNNWHSDFAHVSTYTVKNIGTDIPGAFDVTSCGVKTARLILIFYW